MGASRFIALTLLLALSVTATLLLIMHFAQPVPASYPPRECSLAEVDSAYRAKIHGGAEIIAATIQARAEFDSADDAEALVFKAQVSANEQAGTITPQEREQLFNAIAAYRFVRDRIHYNVGTVGIAAAQDDLATLSARSGKCDEKSLLLVSMLLHLNISSGMEALSSSNEISEEACAQEGLCSCLMRADHAVVAAELPAFKKLMTFEGAPHYKNATYCTKGSRIIIDPSCSSCPFAYGKNCTVSIPILTMAANQG